MPDASHAATISELNRTALSQHVTKLLGETGGLALKSLAFWATENLPDRLPQDPEDIDQSLALWEMDSPRGLYANLEEPDLMDAETLEEAGEVMLAVLQEIYPPLWVRDANLAR